MPTGFSSAVDARGFRNEVTQVPLGGRARVEVVASRRYSNGEAAWNRDFLVLEEPLPAGATPVEGSVQTDAVHYEVDDGTLRLYYAPDQYPGSTTYDVFGYLPGRYRALPPTLRSAYQPGRYHLGEAGALTVLEPGKTSDDPYRPTPDELLARGRALFDLGRFEEAAEALGTLWDDYNLRDDVAGDAARMLLTAQIALENPRPIVRFFEVLREKAPDEVIPFDEILVIGRAYREIGESERAYLVWRATAEASYLEDARVGEVLRQRGRTLEAVAYLLELWRVYPNTASIESDFFGLSQLLASLAVEAEGDPAVRRSLLDADLAPPELLVQSIRLIQVFLAQSPDNPLADEASLALVNAYLDLGDFEKVVEQAERFARLYKTSDYLDSFRYVEALGRFRLGEYDRAIAVAETIANASYREPGGAEVPSPNKWQALYILGQIYHAPTRRQGRRHVLRTGRRPLHRRRRRRSPAHPRRAGAARGHIDPPLGVPPARRRRRSGRPAREGRRRRRSADADGAARIPKHRRGRRHRLPGRPDAALPLAAQPRRHRPGSTWPASPPWSRRPCRSATARTSKGRKRRSRSPWNPRVLTW